LPGSTAVAGLEKSRAIDSLPLPTDALPGSPKKVAILEQRAAAGQALWHPLDAKSNMS
jgi:hypothetical protein